jgi:hypothetical protein
LNTKSRYTANIGVSLIIGSVLANRTFMMNQIEHFFLCPYCFENISMLLDTSIEGEQSYIEDCEVCCQPIQLVFESEEQEITSFDAIAIQ